MIYLEEEKQSLLLPIGLSLAIHALLLLTAIVIPASLPAPAKETVIEVWPTTPEQIDATQKGALRIADIDKPEVENRPDKAKFAGMYDSSVKEETVSRSQKGKGGGKTGGETGKKAKKQTGQKKRIASIGASKDKLFNVDNNLFAMREPVKKEHEASSSPGKVSIGDGGGSSGDYFPDVKVGEYTYLNVLRYPDISYFVRLKRVFRTTFDPGPPLRAYFSTNQIARGSIEVVLGVSVDESGHLNELFVLRGSSIPAYDHEAMRTVRASAPFSAPPKKFLASDGQLRMMWTFTVYL